VLRALGTDLALLKSFGTSAFHLDFLIKIKGTFDIFFDIFFKNLNQAST
jgi:hypothetical protein